MDGGREEMKRYIHGELIYLCACGGRRSTSAWLGRSASWGRRSDPIEKEKIREKKVWAGPVGCERGER